MNLSIECPACGGTGLYHGFMEAPGEYVVCVNCGGSGNKIISYKPFTKRNPRSGVDSVVVRSGDSGARSQRFSYDEFLEKIK